jgi:hypothetical protein
MYKRGIREQVRRCIKGNEGTREEKVYQRKMGLNEEEDIIEKKRRKGSIWE